MNTVDPRNDPHFTLLVEQTEARSWIDLAARKGSSVECRDVEGAVLLLDHQETLTRSRVMLLGLSRPARSTQIERIIRVYKEFGLSSFSIHLSPTARPTSLPRLLEQHGFQKGDQEAVLARSLSGVEAPDAYFRIRTASVSDADAIVHILTSSGPSSEEWARTVASGLDTTNWRYYLAVDGNTPYAMGGLFLDGEVGWMAPTWTLPEYRNRGTQAALIAHILRDGAAKGWKWITTIHPVSGETMTRNYTRLGFELVYMRSTYTWTDQPG